MSGTIILEQMPGEISEMVAVSRGLGSIRVLACGVRRLAERGFPAGHRKLHAGTRRSESRSAPTRSRDALPRSAPRQPRQFGDYFCHLLCIIQRQTLFSASNSLHQPLISVSLKILPTTRRRRPFRFALSMSWRERIACSL